MRAFGTYPITERVMGGIIAGLVMVSMGFAFLAGVRDVARYRRMRNL